MAGNETFTTGAFIINMGVVPQTVANGLKPYGLIYDLIKNEDVPIKWVIGQGKIKDGIDFTYGGNSYRGGTFIICAEYRTASVNAKIAAWQAKGVVGVTTTSTMTLDVTRTLQAIPNWAMDAQNGKIAIKFLEAAEIPASAFYYRTPATLNACDNLYVMPHADPSWATHNNLYFWNKNCRGAIWAGCHAVSAMEGTGCVNPSNPAQNLRFLSTNGLVKWTNHANGTPPYSYSNISDPVYQFMGLEDAAHQNGSEQIYLPLKTTSTWNPSVRIGCYDPTQQNVPTLSDGPAVVTAYGYAFNDTTRGVVMYEAGHDIGGTSAANVAAQRIFFNWSFVGASNKEPRVTYTNIPTQLNSAVLYNNLTATAVSPVGLTSFTYQWKSTIGGVFSAPNSAVTNFTTPIVPAGTPAKIICKVTDPCGRYSLYEWNYILYPIPTAPIAVNDTIAYNNLCAAITTTINVLTNDYDINNDMNNSITFLGGGNYGTFTNNGNGSVTYAPAWNFVGTDTMRYQICDAGGLCATGKIVIYTNAPATCSLWQFQRADSVRADSVMIENGASNIPEILGSSNQSNGGSGNSLTLNTGGAGSLDDSVVVRLDSILYANDTLNIRMASDNNNCVTVIVQGSISSNGWTPGVNQDTITIPPGTSKIYNNYVYTTNTTIKYIKIKKLNIGCDVRLNIDNVWSYPRQCMDGRPTANVDNISTGQNSAITTNVKANDSDFRGLSQTITIQTTPLHGTAGVNAAGNIIYTPNSGYVGTDQFVYRSMNTACLSDTAIVYVNVIGNPCSSGLIGTYHSGNGASVASNVNTANPNNSLGIPDAVNGSNGNSAKISNSAIGNNIIIDLGDTVPTGDTIVIRMAGDAANTTTIAVDGNLTNAWGSPSTTTNFNIPNANKQYANHNFIVAGNTRYVRVRQLSVTMTVDLDALSWNFWVCSAPPNRPPVAGDDTSHTYSNRSVLVNVQSNDTDPDGNTFTTSIISSLNGTVSVLSNNILYTPGFGFTGSNTITYMICDNGTPSLCDTAVLTITVLPGPPVAMKDQTSCNSNSNVTFNVQLNDTLAVSAYLYATTLYPSILPPSNGSAVLVGNSIQYTPNANFNGLDSLCYMLCDNGSPQQCDTAIMYITVNNQAPVVTDDNATTSACNNATINVLANDVDPESQGLTITSVTSPTNGTAVISNNRILYTPPSSPVFTGVATFQYTVCDSGYIPQCRTGNVSVTVNMVFPPSNPPNAVDDVDSTYIGQLLYMNVVQNDDDPDNDSLMLDSTAIGLLAPARGTISYASDKLILYTPTPGEVGIDSFEYKVCDIQHNGAGCVNIVPACTTAMVRLVIQNHPPYAGDDYISTTPAVTVNGDAAQNDVESDFQGMTYILLTPPPNAASFIFNNDGTFTYDPDGIFLGTDTAVYMVSDGVLTDTAFIFIDVQVANVEPNPASDTVTTSGSTPVNGDVSLNDMDPNGNINPNSYSIISNPNTGTLLFNSDGTFTYTTQPGYTGIQYAIYEVCDFGAPSLCSQATLVIIIPNTPPFTFNEYYNIDEDDSLNVPAGTGILSNSDNDPDGSPILLDTVPILNPANGTVTIYSDGSFSYIPNLNFNGEDYFVTNICDTTNACTGDTVFITVNPLNDAVTIDNDNKMTPEDTPVSASIIDSNDFDTDTTTLVVNTTPVFGPLNGGFSIDNAGNYTYTPDSGFNGTDMVVLEVCDSGNPLPASCQNDTLFLIVNAVNDPPVMINETVSTNEDTQLTGNASSNDFDPDTTVLTVNTVPVVNASNGTFSILANGNYTYDPDPDFNGTDLVVVEACDAGNPLPASCLNDTIFITVNAVNDIPVLDNENVSTNEDTPLNGDLTDAGDSDADTTALTANTVPIVDASNGNIVINANGTYTYTPDPGFNGTDLVVVEICDSGTPLPAICVNDTIFITVNAINDAIVLDNENISTNEDVPFNGDLTDAGDSDADSTALTANTVPVVNALNGNIVINANGTYTYTPNPDFNGTDLVVVQICDGGTPLPVSCDNDTIFITVNAINDTPVVINDTLYSIEDSTFSGTLLNPSEFDPDTTTLVVDTVPVLNTSHGIITIDTAGNYTYTPNSNYYGNDTAIFSICDAGNPLPPICVNDTLVIVVAQNNLAPVIANDTIAINEDNVFNGTIITSGDYDPDSLALVVSATPIVSATHGIIVMNSNGTYSYTPDLNYNGTDIAVYEICDTSVPTALCTNDTIVITVNAVNDTAVIVDENLNTNEDTPLNSTILTAGDIDADTTALTVTVIPVSGPSNGNIVMNSNGSFTYTPDPDFNGVDVIVFDVCDGGTPLPVICVHDTLTITVNPVNDTPSITNDAISTNEDIPVGGNVITAGDADPDSTVLSANTTPVSGPFNGNILVNSNGSYTYTPDPDFNGTDTVVISICDSGNPLPASCVNDTLIITVNPVNDNPVAVNNSSGLCSGANVQVSVLLNDSDIDGDSIFVSSLVQPANGSATTDGITITYTPNAGYHGVDTVGYTVCDNGTPQGCSSALVIINVNGPISSGILAHEVLCHGGSTGSVTTNAFFVPTFTYLWNTGATTANITNVPAGLYSVTITDSLGCTLSDTATVLEPAALVLVTTPTNVLCYGNNTGDVQLTVTGGVTAYTYAWDNGDTTQNLANMPAGTYTVTVTDNNNCTSSQSATINQPASALSVSGNIIDANCLNNIQGSVDVTVSGGTVGYSYAWNSGQLTQDITTVAGTYTLVVTDNNSCSDTTTYTINDLSSLIISSYDSIAFCEGDSARLSSSIQNGPFQWMADGVNIPGATDSIYTATQTAIYTIRINNGCGVFTSNAINITANPTPVISISGAAEICEGTSTPFSLSGADSYVWSPGTGLSNSSISNPSASPAITTDYTITGTIGGCSSDTTLTLVVHPIPIVNVTSTTFTCETGSQLNATANTSGTYVWSPAYGLDSTDIASPVAKPRVTTNYFVTVTDSNSCSTMMTVLVVADCDSLKIPNGISPDDDGVNDAFEIVGLNQFQNNSLAIFNRWGSLVYQAKPYHNDWKGTCTEKGVIDGENLPDGTYYYVLELGGSEGTKVGFIEIRR